MDTEKSLLIQKKINAGQSPNDEGPYYHHIWWESYKGGVKGKFGGIVIGALIGSIAGAAMLGIAAVAGIAAITAASPLLVIGAFSAAGALYGAHEFGDVGKVVGGGAAQAQQLEARMKTFTAGKVAEVKQELDEIKSMIGGAPVAQNPKLAEAIANAEFDENNYRKVHYAKLEPDKINSFAFWKVALIGLIIGAAVGALFAGSGLAAGLLGHELGGLLATGAAHGAEVAAAHSGGIMALSMATFGLMGATFGINRDLFRKIFDKTDLLFKGIISNDRVQENQVEAGQQIIHDIEKKQAKEAAKLAEMAVPDYGLDYPASGTHHRDRLNIGAEKALLGFDHTRATLQ